MSGNGRELPIEVQPGGRTVFLLLDCSESMAGSKMLQAQEGAADFAKGAIAQNYAVGIIRFSGEATLATRPTKFLQPTVEVLQTLTSSGSTNMTEALDLALSHLEKIPGCRVVVLVTDGQPDDPTTALAAAQRVAAAGIQIMTIGTDDADLAFLARLATAHELAVKVDQRQLREGIASAIRMLPSPGKSS
jgi:Mg-chelatase subunit ChlD